MPSDRIIQVGNIVKDIYENSTQKKYFEHTMRVFHFVEHLAESVVCDAEIVKVSALLHDIGMTVDASFVGHVKKSMTMATLMLPSLGFSESETAKIAEIIGSHHPIPGSDLDSVEKQILFDADNLDLVGPVGALRWIGTFSMQESLKASAEMFLSIYEKCNAVRGSLFYTPTAQAEGAAALDSTVQYFRLLSSQCSLHINGQLVMPTVF